jgi:hypothetical protein
VAVFLTHSVGSAWAGTYTITAAGPQLCALGTFIASVPGFDTSCDANGVVTILAPQGGSASTNRELWEVDSPSSALNITGAQFPALETVNVNNLNQPGYGGGVYWSGGGDAVNTGSNQAELGFGSDSTGSAFSSQYFGLQLVCGDTSGCDGTGSQSNAQIVSSGTVSFAVQETQGPSLSAAGIDNIFDQTGHWIWNTPGDAWPASISGSDPSGVCDMAVQANSVSVQPISIQPNIAVWQQCPSPETDSASIDTDSFVPTSGPLTLNMSDTNAAGVSNAASATVDVDNVAPTLTITPENDSNPSSYSVNHPVTLKIAATAGPSGIAGISCTDDSNATGLIPLELTPDADKVDSDVTIDGNGVHTVVCGASNNAVNPQGAANSVSATETVEIDEQPPQMSFDPRDPNNPDQVVVQTSDTESPISNGTISIAAQGSGSPITLPTTLNAADQLTTTIPDATLKKGTYTLQATANSQAGNTATISEPVLLPLRAPAKSSVSFARIVDRSIAKRVRVRVRVGFHYVKVKRHGKTVRVKRGGHYKTITVIKRAEHCSIKRVKVAKHKFKRKRTCMAQHVSYLRKATVGHGKRTTIYGELLTSQDVPIADQSVTVLTSPNNGHGRYTPIGSANTNASGGWKLTLPAGPSRIVRASYGGSATLLPDDGVARIYVPARIKISATPTKLPWRGTTTIHGRLVGGYIPADGVAMRLLIKIPGRKEPYSPVPFRTSKTGSFTVRWTWGSGSGVVTYPFSVATTANESDYPYSAATSAAVPIVFGVRTPTRPKHRHRSP